jgi:hypothetical protein
MFFVHPFSKTEVKSPPALLSRGRLKGHSDLRILHSFNFIDLVRVRVYNVNATGDAGVKRMHGSKDL